MRWKMSPRQGTSGRARSLTGAEAGAEVGDDGVGGEAAVGQFQEPHTPGVGVAVLLLAQQVTERGCSVDGHEDRPCGLEDLVMGADADAGQVVGPVDFLGLCNGGVDDVVHGSQGELGVEVVAEQFDHAAVRTMADQHQGQDQLPQPSLGDGQIEKHLVGLGRGSEGLAQRLLGGVSLLVEELPADLMLPSQLRDRFCSGEDLDGQVLPLRRQESLGRPRDRSEVRLRETEGRRSLTIHARFLRVGRGIASPAPIWRKRVFLRNPDPVNGVLPDFEPRPFLFAGSPSVNHPKARPIHAG